MTFNYVSLFSGIGGFEQALNRLGGSCVMASEIDKYANQAYEVLYGHSTVGDVTKVAAEDVPDHDLLVGGFPCQAFSVAGKRLGFEEARGTLFFEIARIAKVKQPKAMMLENVKGLVGHDGGKTLDTIIQTLDEIGYTVDFEVMNSKYFGVPQNRERIFIVAVRNDLIEPSEWNVGKRSDVVAKGKRRIAGLGVKTFNFDFPAQNEVTVRLRNILENDVDEKFYLSEEKTASLITQLENGIAVKEATKQGYAVAEEGDAVNFQFPDSQTRRGRVGKQIAQTLEASGINQGVVEPQMLGHIDLKGHDAIKRVYDPQGVSPTLTTMGGGHREPKIAVQMNRHEINKETDIAHCLMARDYKGFGNQDMTGIIEEVRPVLTPDRLEKRQNGRRFKEDDEESFTLTAQDKHGVAIGNPPKYRIRKLTPRECFRLQGFPDSEFDKLTANGISNSQLYKMAGNAVTVNVISALGRRLLPYIAD
ncbi:DNA (cytosine-5-)-methyltransferase [Bacillus sp. AFS073361]|uniref:DNA (cytosine-5-)-methyltransferase n=1 Tax=Bacillus sp. AFS073361 TaxID=2033511 RepID=UPI000BF927AA|nr:DNA (cytosine-5-)-methyltransferase [Bacillus sp. AFS073361]PFP30238.1 DNA (cytosine-5-)-methyltransferase [Bacillus sp. AFS073361]